MKKAIKQIVVPAMLAILAIVLVTVLNTEANKVSHGKIYDEAILKGFEDGRQSVALEYYIEFKDKSRAAILDDILLKAYINPYNNEMRYVMLRPGVKTFISKYPY